MEKLKTIEQKVIHEFYYTGLSQTEIAKKLGISCNYVSHILRNGTKKLRRILTTEEIKEAQVQLQLASRRPDRNVEEQQPAAVDSLTGIYSAEYISERLQEEVSRAVRSGSELAFAILSVGDFDQYRSRFGAMRADEMFYDMTQLVRKSIRRCDVVGRLGDAEFGIIMPYTGQQSRKVCLRVSKALMETQFEVGGAAVHVDVRFGCSVYPSDARSMRKLMSLARAELERAWSEKTRKAA